MSKMFTNIYAVTIWEKTAVNHTPTYIRHQTGAAYWEDTNGETVNGITRNPDDKALMIVSAVNLGEYVPKADDRIMRGAIEDAQPPKTALTIAVVKDFRYGSSRVQHIEVAAK